jgi:ABC-type sugar transport system ATPase subunit
LKAEGIGIFLISHDAATCSGLHRATVMKNGALINP